MPQSVSLRRLRAICLMISSEQLRDDLLQTDDEFRQLVEQHKELENRISELADRVYRSDTDEVEESVLKKRKLRVKDQMETKLRNQRALTG